LEKLFATEQDVEQASGLQLLSIRVDAIIPDPEQPRHTMPEGSLAELSDSIKQNGVIQPIEVTEIGPGRYKLVHGERRWRAAELAGLGSIPAVVRRRDYDSLTRFVRQLVENVQREDLNDVDRAAALLKLRELMQEQLDAGILDEDSGAGGSPWGKTITWAKVGKRLGMSRQRIHQLIRLLDLPEEIKQGVREGVLSERETRIYQGLQAKQQQELHRVRYKRKLTPLELRQIVKSLKEEPSKSAVQAIEEVRAPLRKPDIELGLDLSFGKSADPGTQPREEDEPGTVTAKEEQLPQEKSLLIKHLEEIRERLAALEIEKVDHQERQEALRHLEQIRQDVALLIAAVEKT
jgi:ParB family chromosome partitioning protein